MKNNPLEIDKYGSLKNDALKKTDLVKKLWSWNFKIVFFPLQSDETIAFLCLIVEVQLLLAQQWLLVLQKQPLEVFYKKVVLRNFAIFTGKHLCWSLFLIKLRAGGHTWHIFKNTNIEEDLLLLVLQKTSSNNICKLAVEVARRHFCEVIFFITEVPFFITYCQRVP